jgi:hypothetical protein
MEVFRSFRAAMPALVSREHVHPREAGRRGTRSLWDRTGYEVAEIGSDPLAVRRDALERLPRLHRGWRAARESER